MRIKSITIELELEEKDIQTHADMIVFSEGMWTANGPMYSRVGHYLNEIWKAAKGIRNES